MARVRASDKVGSWTNPANTWHHERIRMVHHKDYKVWAVSID